MLKNKKHYIHHNYGSQYITVHQKALVDLGRFSTGKKKLVEKTKHLLGVLKAPGAENVQDRQQVRGIADSDSLVSHFALGIPSNKCQGSNTSTSKLLHQLCVSSMSSI